MTDLHSYVVCLHFGPPGPLLTVGAYVAPDQASAAALATHSIMREHGAMGALLSCLVVEESIESLRQRLHAIEKKPEGEVVSLVPQTADAINAILRASPRHVVQEVADGSMKIERAAELLRTAPHGATPIADLSWTLPPDGNIRRSGWQGDDPFDPVA